MKVSLSWLRDYLPIELPVTDLADALTMVGLEVETVTDRYDYLNSVLVGRVTEVKAHPKAGHLQVCHVDAGGSTYTVVCGAPNLRPQMLAPLALADTELPDGNIVKVSQIRGITSEGMLCSEAELGLGPDSSGIMSLDKSHYIGTSLQQALNLTDTVFELGLTPNRPDCLSMIGVAREIAAIENSSLSLPEIQLEETDAIIDNLTSVSIEAWDHCPRYTARLLTDLKVGPSPFWLQNRLLSIGQRPINNLVDITNFVMLETGQPLHAFDFDQLAGHKIVVRTAVKGETFTTLDQKQRELEDNMLMICDADKPVGIAGVMGGLNSEVATTTTRVLIESAYFSPTSIRKTSKRLGLNTDASHRFERGVDPKATLYALDRAAQLMAQIGGGQLIQKAIDEHAEIQPTAPIQLSAKRTNRLLGMSLKPARMEQLLSSVGFKVQKEDSDHLRVTVPSFRVDVSRPEDLVEEVARLEGYDTIPTTFPAVPAKGRMASAAITQRQQIRDILIGFGFNEIINYSFNHPDACDYLRLPETDDRRRQVSILNPLSEDQTVLRTSLIPGLLEVMQRNLFQQIKSVKIFESGRVFIKQANGQLPIEKEVLSGLWTGLRQVSAWHSQDEPCDFYDLKGVLETLFEGQNLPMVTFSRLPQEECFYTRHGYSARIVYESLVLGTVGEVHPQVLKNYDLRQPAYIFELDLSRILSLIPSHISAAAIPRFPFTTRDVTLIVGTAVEAAEIIVAIEKLDEALIESLYIFDVFSGDPIPAGKKSISIRIIYRSAQKTLVDEDVNHIHKQLTHNLLGAFKATLPT